MEDSMSQRVIITGARSAVAVDLAREFHRVGYEVHMADCSSAFIARWSKATHSYHRYASPVHQPERFTADINSLVTKIQPQLIIPTCEEVFHLTKPALHHRLQRLLFAPSSEQLHLLHRKDSFMKLCQKAAIGVPESHTLTSSEALATYIGNSEQWVFKPCYSRFGAQALISPSAQTLQHIMPIPQTPWLAQKRIHGQEFSFYAVACEGEVVSFAPYYSQWRLDGGASYAFVPAPSDAAKYMRHVAQQIATALQLTGQFSCDLMQDANGQFWPIECNPRATSGLHLLCGSGALADVILGRGQSAITGGTRYMLPMMALHGLRTQKLRTWQQTMRSGKDVLGIKEDRLPLLGAMLDAAVFGFNALHQGTSLTQATTADIEWNGEPLA